MSTMRTDEVEGQNAKQNNEMLEPPQSTREDALKAVNAGVLRPEGALLFDPIDRFETEQYNGAVDMIGNLVEQTANVIAQWASRRIRK